MRVTYEETSYTEREENEWYAGVVTGIQDAGDYGYGPTLRVIISLDDDDEEHDTWAMCSAKLSPQSKLYQWVKGVDAELIPAPGGTVDLERLVGRRVQAMFGAYQAKDGSMKQRVEKLRAEKSAAPSKPARPTRPVRVEDTEPF